MSFFKKILNALGIGDAEAATPAAEATSATETQAPVTETTPAAEEQRAPISANTVPNAVPVVDVVAQLELKAAENQQKLNWKTSIVDLLKLLDMDSSLTARKELATELGCPADLMSDSAQMNMWLHKRVLARIAENGGNIPADLLD